MSYYLLRDGRMVHWGLDFNEILVWFWSCGWKEQFESFSILFFYVLQFCAAILLSLWKEHQFCSISPKSIFVWTRKLVQFHCFFSFRVWIIDQGFWTSLGARWSTNRHISHSMLWKDPIMIDLLNGMFLGSIRKVFLQFYPIEKAHRFIY